jgi:predicted nucleic-acid-binding protein
LSHLEAVLGSDVFMIEADDVVREAIRLSKEGPGDFPDYPIDQLNAARGCRFTVTFDRALRSDPAFFVF